MKHYCYFNLHKKLFSIRNQKTRLVEAHSDLVVLSNCNFKVSEAGRQRVLRDKRKNVHAGVEGEFLGTSYMLAGEPMYDLENDFIELTYNPYLYDSFVVKATEVPIKSAKLVVLKDKRVFAKDISSLPLTD